MITTVFFLYTFLMVWLILGLRKKVDPLNNGPSIKLSVVVAFRNEESNLKRLVDHLSTQSLTKEDFEVIFVNDHSDDDGESILKSYLALSDLDARVISLENNFGKKEAIELGVNNAKHELIVTTDADCIMGESWLYAMMNSFQDTRSVMVLGPVRLKGDSGLWNELQKVEFSTLMGMTLATGNNEKPILSNGANCAFKKSTFQKLNPYGDNKKTHTGDDVFLLHCLKKNTELKIRFCNHPDSLVETDTKATVRSFFDQRLRWASKTKNYRDKDTIVIGSILFLTNLSILFLMGNVLLGKVSIEKLILIFLYKWILDLLFLQQIPLWLRTSKIVRNSFLLSILYPIYSVGIALLSLLHKPQWKGRKI